MMPAYNAGKYIDASLKSVLQQDYEDMEVIIVDDCSTDDTYDIASGFRRHPKVRLYRNKKRLGDYNTRNRILRLARGKYIAPHDADDIMLQGRLRRHVLFLEKQPDFGAVFGSFLEADEKLTKLSDTMRVEGGGRSGPVKQMPGSFSHCAATIVKKHMVLAGGYDTGSPIGGDTSLFLRIFMRTRFYFLNNPCFIYRIHSKSKTQRRLLKGAEIYKRIFYGPQRDGRFSVTIGTREVVVYGVDHKTFGVFQWRLACYNQYKPLRNMKARGSYKIMWKLPQDAALANSDAEKFQRGFLEPFSKAVSDNKQMLVRAALLSYEGNGILFFADDATGLNQAILPLILRHRYTYHSNEAAIVFFKDGKAYGESFVLPIVPAKNNKWVKKEYKRRLLWNPLINKYYFDLALSFPYLIGAQCKIVATISIVVDRGMNKISLKSLKPAELYNLVVANVYGKETPCREQRGRQQALVKQIKGFLIKTPQAESETLTKKLVRLTRERLG